MFQALKKVMGLTSHPPKEFAEEAMAKTRFTPDIVKLELAEWQLLFVVDDMQRGGPLYSRIQEYSAFQAIGFTEDRFNYFVDKSNGTPVPLLTDPRNPLGNSGQLFGEVHAVKSAHYPELDTIRQNGVQFLRKRINVIIPYRDQYVSTSRYSKKLPPQLRGLSEEKLSYAECHMYIGIPEVWQSKIKTDLCVSELHREFQEVNRYKSLKPKGWLAPYFQFKPPKNE